jgi:hypothetical protein
MAIIDCLRPKHGKQLMYSRVVGLNGWQANSVWDVHQIYVAWIWFVCHIRTIDPQLPFESHSPKFFEKLLQLLRESGASH